MFFSLTYSQILDANRNVFRAILKLFTDEELRIEHGNWFMPPDPRRQMRVHRTVFSTAEPPGRHEQMTECDLQHRTARRVRIQAPIHASLCTSSDTVWTRCAVARAANANGRESSRRHVSIFQLHKASSPRHSSRAADDQEHTEVRQRGGCCNSQSCWLQRVTATQNRLGKS